MKRRILVLVPLFTPPKDAETIRNYLENYAFSGTEIDVIGTQENVAVNSRAEMDYAVPEFLDLAIKAEKDGYDAIISYCYNDVGVNASRKIVKIPIIGPFISSITVANMLGQNFSVLSTEFPLIKGMKRASFGPSQTRDLGIGIKNYVSTREIPYEKFFVFSGDPKQVEIMKNAMIEVGKKAISDGAEVLILACTGFLFSLEELNVPVIDSSITLKVAEALIDINRNSSSTGIEGKDQAKMKIKVLVPTNVGLKSQTIDKIEKIVNEGTDLSIVKFEKGPKSIRSAYDAAQTSRFILKETSNAAKEGYDAVVICSFEDYYLDSARELSEIPVIGLGQTAILFSGLFGNKFSVVTNNKQSISIIETIARKSDIEKRLLSVKYVGIQAEKKEVLEQIENAVKEGAETVIMGVVESQELIQSIPLDVKVPVLDPLPIALKMAEVLHALKLSHSKILYPIPALPDYHRQRLEKLEESKQVKEKLETSMFLYE